MFMKRKKFHCKQKRQSERLIGGRGVYCACSHVIQLAEHTHTSTHRHIYISICALFSNCCHSIVFVGNEHYNNFYTYLFTHTYMISSVILFCPLGLCLSRSLSNNWFSLMTACGHIYYCHGELSGHLKRVTTAKVAQNFHQAIPVEGAASMGNIWLTESIRKIIIYLLMLPRQKKKNNSVVRCPQIKVD